MGEFQNGYKSVDLTNPLITSEFEWVMKLYRAMIF